jgi:hypothetical protein
MLRRTEDGPRSQTRAIAEPETCQKHARNATQFSQKRARNVPEPSRAEARPTIVRTLRSEPAELAVLAVFVWHSRKLVVEWMLARCSFVFCKQRAACRCFPSARPHASF